MLCHRRSTCLARDRSELFQQARVLIVVTIDAQQLPVAAVARVVVVIVITMMDGEFLQVGAREFARTAAAHPRIELQGLFAITARTLFTLAARLRHHLVELGLVERAACLGHQPCNCAMFSSPARRKRTLRPTWFSPLSAAKLAALPSVLATKRKPSVLRP